VPQILQQLAAEGVRQLHLVSDLAVIVAALAVIVAVLAVIVAVHAT
jgi:hypothetical protein